MEPLLKPFITSEQIPAGQTRPVKIPTGSKTRLELVNLVGPGISGSVIFNDIRNSYNINYSEMIKVIDGLEFPGEEGCFFNHSTGIIDATVIITAFSDLDQIPISVELEEPLDLSPEMPAGQTRPVKIPNGKKIKIIEEPLGTVGQLLLHHVEPPEIIDYPQADPTDKRYFFENDICIMTNMGPIGTSIQVLAVD